MDHRHGLRRRAEINLAVQRKLDTLPSLFNVCDFSVDGLGLYCEDACLLTIGEHVRVQLPISPAHFEAGAECTDVACHVIWTAPERAGLMVVDHVEAFYTAMEPFSVQ